ncbi:MAG: cytochrome c oxidase subunit 3 [Leptospiraceae bacterium]
MILSIEMLTFIPALIVFFAYRYGDANSFMESAQTLNLTLGTVNTGLLIVGGWCVAEGIRNLRLDQKNRSSLLIWLGVLTGAGFLALKGFEYYQKLDSGYGLNYDTFFTMYWLITGFHFLHVVVGTFLLIVAALGIRKMRYSAADHEDVETIGVFWHMCDLIWILVFPSIYILARGGM